MGWHPTGGGAGSDTDAIHDNVAAEVSAVAEKTVPVAADLILIEDSESSNAKKKLQIGNLPLAGGISSFFSGAHAYRDSTNQTLSNATATAIQFNAEVFDTDAYHDNSTNPSRFTVPNDGKYRITASVTFDGDGGSTGWRNIHLRINGTTQYAGQAFDVPGTSIVLMTTTALFDLTAADYVEVWARQDSGGNLDIIADTKTMMTIERVGGFSGARVYRTTDQTLTTATATAVIFTAEDFDTDAYHDNSTNPSRVTVPADGYYRLTVTIGWATSTDTGQRHLHFRVNGVSGTQYGNQLIGHNNTNLAVFQTSTILLNLSSGDYVEAWARQDSGGNLDIDGDTSGQVEMTIERVGS